MSFPTLGFVSSSAHRSAIAKLVCSRGDGSSLLCDKSGVHFQLNGTDKTLPLIDLVDSQYSPGWFWGTIKLVAKNGERFRITGLPKSGARGLATAIVHNHKAAIQASVASLADHLAHADSEITAFTQRRSYLSAQISRYLISISNCLKPLLDLELKPAQLPDTILNQLSRVANFRTNHQRLREVLNEKFVEEELDRTKSFLDQIEKNPLTPAQRENAGAIVHH
ncbi:MAG TPA: hypothetical protein VMX97_17680 [Hyphomicrobiaceae bacterium]|nr:hypothetical protein [Hyphomicrobiaceae bacterium]